MWRASKLDSRPSKDLQVRRTVADVQEFNELQMTTEGSDALYNPDQLKVRACCKQV